MGSRSTPRRRSVRLQPGASRRGRPVDLGPLPGSAAALPARTRTSARRAVQLVRRRRLQRPAGEPASARRTTAWSSSPPTPTARRSATTRLLRTGWGGYSGQGYELPGRHATRSYDYGPARSSPPATTFTLAGTYELPFGKDRADRKRLERRQERAARRLERQRASSRRARACPAPTTGWRRAVAPARGFSFERPDIVCERRRPDDSGWNDTWIRRLLPARRARHVRQRGHRHPARDPATGTSTWASTRSSSSAARATSRSGWRLSTPSTTQLQGHAGHADIANPAQFGQILHRPAPRDRRAGR